jgi:membrane-bound serine protease (ClpP class)
MDFLIDPNVAYFMLVGGFLMAIFSLFSPGTGILELGALFTLVLAGYALFNLPLNLWALGLLAFGVVPFILALRKTYQIGYLIVALVSLTAGSIFLFRSETGLTAVNPFLATLVSVLSFGLTWFVTRAGLEAIRQPASMSMERYIGQTGEALTDMIPEGNVYVGGEEWTARSQAFISAGSLVRVAGRDGLVLIVEPIEDREESAQSE